MILEIRGNSNRKKRQKERETEIDFHMITKLKKRGDRHLGLSVFIAVVVPTQI